MRGLKKAALAVPATALLIGLSGAPASQGLEPSRQAATPKPADSGAAERRIRAMKQRHAKIYIARHLKSPKDGYGRPWRFGDKKRIYDCRNVSRIRVRCKVSWTYNDKYAFKGDGTAFYKPNRPGLVWTRIDIDVDRI